MQGQHDRRGAIAIDTPSGITSDGKRCDYEDSTDHIRRMESMLASM